ncbi:MAG TPA: glycosyltransferase [Chloroflexota bacterium]|nr:glycosyltransferase [Chloroflexota bacterium]
MSGSGGRGAVPVVSACMIVRNEEANLGRVLRSLEGAVDEIVVVDTGSSDATVDIAREHGADVRFFEWCDDFSAARNESLRYATGDFVLWIDADDELLESRPGALRGVCEELAPDAWGCWMDVHCPSDEWAESETVVKQIRIFRNHRRVRFHGRVHEQVTPPPDIADVVSFQSAVAVKHWGYVDGGDVARRRSERNRRLVRLAIAEEPAESFHYYNLALDYAGQDEWPLALNALEEGLRLWEAAPVANDGHVANMYANAVFSAVQVQDYARALALQNQTPTKYLSSELLHHAGVAHWRLGRHADALASFDRALREPSLVNSNLHERSTSTWRPLLLKASVYFELNDYERAYECARQAAAHAPGKPEALLVLAVAAKETGRTEEAVSHARDLLSCARAGDTQAKARKVLLNIASERKDPKLAAEAVEGPVEGISPADALWLQAQIEACAGNMHRESELLVQACQMHPGHHEIRLRLSQVLEAQGFLPQALEVLASALDHPPVPSLAYQRLSILLARQGRLEDAANALELAGRSASEHAVL